MVSSDNFFHPNWSIWVVKIRLWRKNGTPESGLWGYSAFYNPYYCSKKSSKVILRRYHSWRSMMSSDFFHIIRQKCYHFFPIRENRGPVHPNFEKKIFWGHHELSNCLSYRLFVYPVCLRWCYVRSRPWWRPSTPRQCLLKYINNNNNK